MTETNQVLINRSSNNNKMKQGSFKIEVGKISETEIEVDTQIEEEEQTNRIIKGKSSINNSNNNNNNHHHNNNNSSMHNNSKVSIIGKQQEIPGIFITKTNSNQATKEIIINLSKTASMITGNKVLQEVVRQEDLTMDGPGETEEEILIEVVNRDESITSNKRINTA